MSAVNNTPPEGIVLDPVNKSNGSFAVDIQKTSTTNGREITQVTVPELAAAVKNAGDQASTTGATDSISWKAIALIVVGVVGVAMVAFAIVALAGGFDGVEGLGDALAHNLTLVGMGGAMPIVVAGFVYLFKRISAKEEAQRKEYEVHQEQYRRATGTRNKNKSPEELAKVNEDYNREHGSEKRAENVENDGDVQARQEARPQKGAKGKAIGWKEELNQYQEAPKVVYDDENDDPI